MLTLGFPMQEAAAIHILAHSMGNRIALEALSKLETDAPDVIPRLGQLIFAAADEDSRTFKEKFKKFSSAGVHIIRVQAVGCNYSLVVEDKDENCMPLVLVSRLCWLPGLGRTLYLSSQDPALVASAIIHYDNRAGQAWPQRLLVPYRLRRPYVLAAGLDCSGATLPSQAGPLSPPGKRPLAILPTKVSTLDGGMQALFHSDQVELAASLLTIHRQC